MEIYVFLEISRDKRGINDRAFDSSTSLFVPSHEILFSRVCGPLLRERERERETTGFTAKSASGTGCWLCNMNVEDCRGKLCSKEKKGRRARCPVKSQGVVVVLVPYYDSECFSWPLRNFYFFFILYYLQVQLNAKVTISRFENIPNSLRPNFHNISKRILIINTAERRS